MATVDVLKPKGTKNAWTWENIERNVDVSDEVTAGASNHVFFYVAATAHSEDEHVDQLEVSLENPIGVDKTLTVTLTNGVSTMTVNITGDTDVFGKTTTNNFDWDVSAQPITMKFTSTAGSTTGHIGVHIHKHLVTIT